MEEDFLQLSGIQHFAFCRRRWALAYIELQWNENVKTIEGKLMHERAHDGTIVEKRGDIIISRGIPVCSREMGVSGECDVVEFHKDVQGINLFGYEGLYKSIPIEYKRGKPKDSDIDVLQLAAQIMCLEEMLCCEIKEGYLFYGETRRRMPVKMTEELRGRVKEMFIEMHQLYEKKYTPKVRRTKKCNACSLKDICLPVLNKIKTVDSYIEKAINNDL